MFFAREKSRLVVEHLVSTSVNAMATPQRKCLRKVTLLFLLFVLSIVGPILLLLSRRFFILERDNDDVVSFHFPPVLVRPIEPATNGFAASKPNKVIMLWVPFFRQSHFGFGLGEEPFKRVGCDVATCEVTVDRSRLIDSDAVVFHLSNVDPGDLPTVRFDDQRWIFFTKESPTHTAWARTGRPIIDLRPLDGHFNWTMTYRRDSDIHFPYFHVLPTPTANAKSTTTNKIKRQKRLVSWLVSNCRTSSKRESYVNALRSHVTVDIYGACGGRKRCPRPCHGVDNHKFYLSFENSVCRDYVTEKLSSALLHDLVPIVYGGADYADIMPPHSYIDVRDYDSPGHLARRLLELDKNESAYREYFAWKSSYSILDDDQLVVSRAFCDLCAALHDDAKRRPTKTYDELHRWWVEEANCSTDVPLGFPRLMHLMKLAKLELAHGFPRGT